MRSYIKILSAFTILISLSTSCSKNEKGQSASNGVSIVSYSISPIARDTDGKIVKLSQIKVGQLYKMAVVEHYSDNSESVNINSYSFNLNGGATNKGLDFFNQATGGASVYAYTVNPAYSIVATKLSDNTINVGGSLAVIAGPAYTLATGSGNLQSATVGTKLAQPLSVKLKDKYGNPVANSHVVWSATDGSLSSTDTVTGEDGAASVDYTVGSQQGLYSVKASSADAISNKEINFTISANKGSSQAAQLAFSVQPSAAGLQNQALAQQPVISVLDNNGSLLTSGVYPIAIAAYKNSTCSTPAPGILSGNSLIVPSANGKSAFAGLNYNANATIYLKASSGDMKSACSLAIRLKPQAGIASQLIVTQQVGSAVQDKAIYPVVKVSIADGSGVTVASATNSLTLSAFKDAQCSVPAPGTLSGASADAQSGIAQFTNFKYFNSAANLAQQNETIYLAASASQSALNGKCSGAIVVKPNLEEIPTQLKFSVVEATEVAGQMFLISPRVNVLNQYGNVVSQGTFAVSLAAYTDASCTIPAPGVVNFDSSYPYVDSSSGYAVFSGIRYSGTGSIYLKATVGDLGSTCSSVVSIAQAPPGLASKLAFSAQPSDGVAGQALPVQPVVAALQVDGSPATSSAIVTLSVFSDSLCRNKVDGFADNWMSQNSVNGSATFSAVSFQKAGTYYLKAKSSNLQPICSSAFHINAAAANKLVKVDGDNQSAQVHFQLPNAIKVQVLDSFNNPVANYPVNFEPVGGGGSFSQAVANSDANGMAQSLYVLGSYVGTQTFKAYGDSIPMSPFGTPQVTFVATGTLPSDEEELVATGSGVTAKESGPMMNNTTNSLTRKQTSDSVQLQQTTSNNLNF